MRNDGVDDVLGEPLPCEVAGRLRARPTALDYAPGPLRLAVEQPDHILCDLVVDPGESELVSDSLLLPWMHGLAPPGKMES